LSTTKQKFYAHRARYASLTRSRPVDDPELIAERQAMREEALVGAVERALDTAPPLTPPLRDRIIALLTKAAAS
jgi:hypothetical protein